MKRYLCLAVASLLTATAARGDEIKLNSPVHGKFPKDPQATVRIAPRQDQDVYQATVEVTLEAGWVPTVSATADGPQRHVAVVVLGPKGDPVAGNVVRPAPKGSGGGPRPKAAGLDAVINDYALAAAGRGQALGATAKTTVPAVPVSGTYTVLVLSNFPGDFVLEVKDPKAKPAAPAVRDAAAIQREIDATRKKLAELEAELKAVGVGK